jgi:hypothetical protein
MRCRLIASRPLPYLLPCSLALGGFLLLAASVARAEDALGVLLFSPAQRQAIERARVSDASAPDAPPEVASVAGWVKRAGGRGTVWINGEPWAEGQKGFLPQAPVISAQAVRVQGERLRAGEALDLATGQRSDFAPQGAVSVRPGR